MFNILAVLFQWLLREAVLKVAVLGVIYALVAFLVPLVVSWVSPFIGVAGLTSAFDALPDGVFYFLYLFKVDVGLPLLISAAVAVFLIRRLPLIG